MAGLMLNPNLNLNLSSRDQLQGYLLTGPDSLPALGAAGLPTPEAVLSATAEQGALVARTGQDEYLLYLPAGQTAPDYEWCFTRSEKILAVTGEGWIELMAQLCQFDFRQMACGDWLMASVAGVNCWLYREATGALLIGFDRGYDHYLSDIFRTLVHELGGTELKEGGAS